jgi:hypothetical protein
MAPQDLSVLLSNLSVSRRPGRWCLVTGIDVPVDMPVAATVMESEGMTSVLAVSDAENLGIEPDFAAAWLTLDVHSTMHDIGLTAAVSTALAEAGIACNVLAGFHHDHLLVPFHEADRATRILNGLRRSVAE